MGSAIVIHRASKSKYDRLIYKIRNYTKYQDDWAIEIDKENAYYFGNKQFAEMVLIVSRTEQRAVYILEKTSKTTIRYSEKDPLQL